jgi:hypothetical protein
MNFETPQTETKESLEPREEQAAELMGKEATLMEGLSDEKFRELKKSGRLRKFVGGLIMASAILGFAKEAEAGSWKVGKDRRVKDRVVREVERYGRRQERGIDVSMEQAKRDLGKRIEELSEAIETEEENIEKFKKQTGGDMTSLIEQSEAKIKEYEEERKEAGDELSKLKKIDFAKDVGMEVLDVFTGGGSWGGRRRF